MNDEVSVMSRSRYLSVDDLPPKPDLLTGLPRPPRAPGFLGMETESLRERNSNLTPRPPAGQGPVLIWYQNSRSGAIKSAIACVFVLAVLGSISAGSGWLSEFAKWDTWALLFVFACAIYFLARAGRFSAGADWVAKRGRWVRVYELTKVTAHGYYNGAGMLLKDSGGRKVKLRFIDLSSDRLLWDLTYNGILHSVIAGGAKTNGTVRKSLALPEPMPKREADAQGQG